MTGLDPWYATHNNIANVRMSCFGDSTSFGDINVSNGGWVEQFRQLANARWGKGGDGLHYLRNITFTTAGDAWTAAVGTDVWDSHVHVGGVKFANGATKIATWTKPAPVVASSFEILIVDGPTSADMSYRIDGGSWIACGFTLTQNNQLKRIRINSPVTTTVDVRAANAAGTAVNAYFGGIAPYRSTPGLICDNVAIDGNLLRFQERTTSGQVHSYVNEFKPKLATVMYTNDVVSGLWDQALYQTNMQNLCDAVTAQGGSVLFLNFFEQQRSAPDGGTVSQAQLRAATKAAAAAKGMPVIDFFDLVGDNAAAQAAGYMDSNPLHATNAGCVYIAQQVWSTLAKSGVGRKLRAA